MTLVGSTAQAVQSGVGSVDAAYVVSETGGKTTCTVNVNTTLFTFVSLDYLEVSSTSSASFDGCNAQADGSSSTTNPAPAAPLVMTGTNDIFTQTNIPTNSATAISGGYNINSSGVSDGLGSAYLLNQSTYTAPNWTQSPAGTAAVNMCALKQ